MTGKNILIVGGAGYIGSHVNKMLHQAGYRTVILDNLSRGDRDVVLYGDFIQGDMGDDTLLEQLFSTYSFDAVMHFGAFIDVGESLSYPDLYFQNNVAKTERLLQAMLRYSIQVLIFSSTAAVYGLPLQEKIGEDHPVGPINPYGTSKLLVEQRLCSLEKSANLKYCILRYFNAAGGDPEGEIKNRKKISSNLIPVALRSIQNQQESLKIFGTDYPTPDGTCIRDYIHIHDLGAAHIAALERLLSGAPSNTYNLGNGEGFSVQTVLDTIEKVTKQKVLAVAAGRRPGDPAILVADANKAKKELGWHPLYPDLAIMISHAWQALLH